VELDLRQLLRIARQYWWLVALLMLVAGATAYYRSSQQPELYSTSSRVLLLGEETENVTSYTAQLASQNLTLTYLELIESDNILQAVDEELDLPFDYIALDGKVSTSAIEKTLLLQITVVDTDAERAALIADTVALKFIEYINDNQGSTLSSPVEMAATARIPTTPFEPNPTTAGLLGAFVGLLLGVALVALLEFLDNTIKPQQEVEQLTGAPLLASVPQLQNLKPGGHQVYTVVQPRSSAAEALRLEFAAASSDIRRLVVSSPNPGEGKSTTAANLGVVMAQGGMKVVIIDADLRRPTQHRVFGVPGDEGLTTLLTHPDRAWDDVAKRVAVANLMLIPAGPLPPNPSDLVSSQRFIRLLDKIDKEVDLIIIDSPPILAASDSLAIAAHADGVVLVCFSNRTRIDAVHHSAQSIRQGGIRLIGVVLNRTKKQQGASYYGNYYYSQATNEQSTQSAAD
jgi:non-specific protein-tyrosine kinase